MGVFLVRNCDIADFDTLGQSRKDILIEGNTVTRIEDKIESNGTETVIDANGMLAMPGFVDCHTHLMQTFCKGYLDDYPITDWLIRMFNIEGLMSEEDNYYAVLLGCLEGLRFGTTTINDMCGYTYIDSTVQAILDSGMRGTVGMSHTDIAENEVTPLISVEEALKQSEEIFTRYHNSYDDMIRVACAPAGLPACSKEIMQALKQFARERKTVFHTHLAEGKKETKDVYDRTDMWEGETLFEYGILDEYTLLAHSIWLEDYELDLIKKAGANPVHCPSTNMKISDGIPKIQAMLERDINVCIGCDGEASSSSRDMVREARAGAYLQKGVTLNPAAMDLSTTYKMLTQNGARALHYDYLGSIEVGKRADFILVDTKSDLSLSNQQTRMSNFLYAGTGHAVDTAFVNGNLVLRNTVLQSVDLNKVLEKSEELLAKLDKKVATL
jgi:Cytosine deaminase and related metal-dependent hydrolases